MCDLKAKSRPRCDLKNELIATICGGYNLTSLTPAAARAAMPGDILRDHEVTGLHLRCTRTKKAWYLYYRTRAGDERRPRLGDFPELTLSAAREAAKALKQSVALGNDPAASWAEKRAAATVSELCDLYLSDWAPEHKKPRSVQEDRWLIEGSVKPGLGARRVMDLEAADIEEFLRDVQRRKYVSAERKKQDGKRTAPGARNRTRALLSRLMQLALDRYKMLPKGAENPVAGTAKAKEAGRRRLMTPTELQAVVAQLRALFEEKPRHVAAIMAMLLTGARVGEIRRARRRHWQGAALVLDDHKTDRHIGDKIVPLPPDIVALLEGLDAREPWAPNDLLFGGCDIRRVWRAVRVGAGCPDLQMRDLRRAFASYALTAGKSLDQIGDVFGHTDTQTTRGYSWLLQDSRQALVSEVAGAMLQIADRKPGD